MKFICYILLFISSVALAQKPIKAVLLNKADKMPMPYAWVKIDNGAEVQLTDSLGRFSFKVADSSKQVQLEIADIGCHTTILYKLTGDKVEKVLVEKQALTIPTIAIEGLTAPKVVEKAIAEIPNNYATKSYFTNSFFRQYHKENGKFVRLIEVQGINMFQLEMPRKQVKCKDAMAIVQMRRGYDYEVNRLPHLDHFFDLLIENPIYHPVGTALNPRALSFFKFRFDTTAHLANDYVVLYESKDYNQESLSSGKITIDKTTYAIKKIVNSNEKNTNGDYRSVLSETYGTDFVNGSSVTEYQQIGDKWYLKKMLREYTNKIYYRISGITSSNITECFEWYADSTVTDRVSAEYADKFGTTVNLYSGKYTYNPLAWQKELPPFVYFTQEEVYKSMSRKEPIEEQFLKAGQ